MSFIHQTRIARNAVISGETPISHILTRVNLLGLDIKGVKIHSFRSKVNICFSRKTKNPVRSMVLSFL